MQHYDPEQHQPAASPIAGAEHDTPADRVEEWMRGAFATLAFAHEHADAIRAGDKTATVRLPAEYDRDVLAGAAAAGGQIRFVTPDGDTIAWAEIRAVIATTGKRVAASLIGGHAEWSAPDEVVRALERYYGRELSDDPEVDVVVFDVTEVGGDE